MQVAWGGVIIEAFQENFAILKKNCYPSVVCSVAAFGRVFVEAGAAINVRSGLVGTGHSPGSTG